MKPRNEGNCKDSVPVSVESLERRAAMKPVVSEGQGKRLLVAEILVQVRL